MTQKRVTDLPLLTYDIIGKAGMEAEPSSALIRTPPAHHNTIMGSP